MTALAWDEVGERRYETGVDRGVLYPRNGVGVPWNGLTAITEVRAKEVKSYYSDGIKYLDHQVLGAFSGTLQAYTYPDELDVLTGNPAFAAGVFLHDQPVRAFSLSYRTRIGNDLDGEDHGYKLHLLYNVLAAPGDFAAVSLAKSVTPQVFEWTLNAVPPLAVGIRPTAHISLNTRSIDPDLLSDIEDILYGTVSTDPEFPDLIFLLEMIEEFYT